jgi:hypothetical protein
MAKETKQMRRHAKTDQAKRMEVLQEQTRTFLRGVRQTVRQMKKAASDLMVGYHGDHVKARQVWQQMATSMAKKQEGGPQSPAGSARCAEREENVGQLLQQSTSGMTLAELSYALDMPSTATSKILKRMLKRKPAVIRKKGPVYLAV